MGKDDAPLDKLAERIRRESPLPVFPLRGGIPGEGQVYWEGDDVGEFLALAKKVGAPIIYLAESIADSEDEDPARASHAGETAFVEAAFLLDGEFHVFAQFAEWVPEDDQDAEAGEDGDTASIALLSAHKDEWAKEFLDELRNRPEPIEPNRFILGSALGRFLAPKLSTPSLAYHSGIPRDGSPLDGLIQKMGEEIATTLRTEESANVEPLVPECVAWATKLGIRSLSKSDVDAFMLERRARFSSEGQRLLWTKAKLAVKVGRSGSA